MGLTAKDVEDWYRNPREGRNRG